MTEKVPTPDRDTHGLPLCSEAKCALFDGKRCSALGYQPDRFCEPALIETRDALLHLANAFAVAPDLTPTQMGVHILEAVTAKLRESSNGVDVLHQEIVALRMAKLEVITAAQDLAKEAEREKLKLINLRGYNMRLLSLLKDCPFGHANGQIIWHRSTTTAELVSWVDEVYKEARRPADEADGSPETATSTVGARSAALTPQTPMTPHGTTAFGDLVHAEGGAAGALEVSPAKLPPGWFLLKTVTRSCEPSDKSIIPGPPMLIQVSQVSGVLPTTREGVAAVYLSAGQCWWTLGEPASIAHDLWVAGRGPNCAECGRPWHQKTEEAKADLSIPPCQTCHKWPRCRS